MDNGEKGVPRAHTGLTSLVSTVLTDCFLGAISTDQKFEEILWTRVSHFILKIQ